MRANYRQTPLIQGAAWVAGVCVGVFLASASAVSAQRINTQPASDVVTCGDSAYQLFRATTPDGSGVQWKEAVNKAPRLRHHGRNGRLAIIPNMRVHACVSEKLLPKAREEAWIGLRYWCNYRTLQWLSGDIRPHEKRSPWAVQWSRYGTCRTQFTGVYYTTSTKRWQAVEQDKRFRYMVVEYPPVTDAARKQTAK
ncbi:C-type lectin domain-containing protein [Rhodovibrio sodomensis]|uniref:C-type lectin domain-containing protein n=1 Tax=Rhodovibrio sodomensis TaxID=1088 RepID=UPI001907B1A9|nr:C-type lectin domain-containing protein [Rhodovibrio sodomensis]